MTHDQPHEPLWRWAEACRALDLAETSGPDIHGVSIDSRSLAQGDLFVALSGDPGPRFNTGHRTDRDGHDYVGDAARRGAAGALVHRHLDLDLPQLQVADTLDGLWALGRTGRSRFQGRVFGLTGSSGKTTVKAYLAAALGCPAAQGSLNNFWGVPLSLARTPAAAGAAVFEVGTNHPGEIAPLSRLVRPDVALVLNVLPAHLANFPSLAALRQEKLSMAEGIVPGGRLVLAEDLLPHAPVDASAVVSFGTGKRADVQLLSYDPKDQQASFRIRNRTLAAYVPGGGEHRAQSLAATMACLLAADFDPALACNLDESCLPSGRGRTLLAAGVQIIDDSYNANPVSMAKALQELRAASGTGRRFAILGEMLELGDASGGYHAGLAPDCAGLDGVWCVGPGMRSLHEALPDAERRGYAETQAELDLSSIAAELQPGDQVLVKGSNLVFWASGFVQRLVQVLNGAGPQP